MSSLIYNDTLLDLIVIEILAQDGLLVCRAVSRQWLRATARVYRIYLRRMNNACLSLTLSTNDYTYYNSSISITTCLWEILRGAREVNWHISCVNISLYKSCMFADCICYTCGRKRTVNSIMYDRDGIYIGAYIGTTIRAAASIMRYIFAIENYTITGGRDSFALVNYGKYCTDHHTGYRNDLIRMILSASLREIFGKSLTDVYIVDGFQCD